MNLLEQVNHGIKTAMLAREGLRLEALRAVKAAILVAMSEKGQHGPLSPESEIRLLQKLVKQREEAAEIYGANNRPELQKKEMDEAEVIREFLPAAMGEEEIREVIRALISEAGATGPADMGKVMRLASPKLAGKADGKTIADTVKKLLSEM